MTDHCTAIGQGFVQLYYERFQNNKTQLQDLYCDASMMTFEGATFQGTANIMKRLQELPFKKVVHIITSLDCQPILGVDGGEAVLIVVMGQLKTDDDPPHSFIQSFVLRKTNDSYVIGNEVFRMVLHNT